MRHYAEYLLPGFIVSESTVKELPLPAVLNIDVERKRAVDAALSIMPQNAVAFRLFDKPNETDVRAPEGYELVPQRLHETGWHYLGERLDTEGVKRKIKNNDVLLDNMRINRWNEVVLTRTGQVFQIDENVEDVLPDTRGI